MLDRDDDKLVFSVRAVRTRDHRDRRGDYRGPSPSRPDPPDLPLAGTDGRLGDDDLSEAIVRAAVVGFMAMGRREQRACLLRVLPDPDDARAALEALPRLGPGLARW